jgi:glycosyltransferase involved in cell wall biosynthesis
MAGFDLFVLTSTIEGFPNVLLEAAFLGIPSIASRVGGSPDVLARSQDTFEAGDAAAAAERVLTFIESPPVARAGADLTQLRAMTLFTADRTAARWFALYDPPAPRARHQTDHALVRRVRLQADQLSKEALQ